MIAQESIAPSDPRPAAGARRAIAWRQLAIYAIAATLSAWLSVATRPPILGDDAAIGLRYAERIANGQGFTYNGHERVCGASNPLWTLLISLGPRVGLDVESTTRLLTSVFYVIAAVLASAVAVHVGGALIGLLVAVAVPADVFWRVQALAGLELPLALSLGLAAILAASKRRDCLAGTLLGLAMITKLDAVALVIAVTVASSIAYRRLPIRMLGSALLVSLPWFLFALIYFGFPWPQSLSAKLTHGSGTAMNHFWIVEYIASDLRYGLWILAVMGLVVSAKAQPARRMIVVSLFGWFLLHSVAYSFMNLGELYPWYMAIPATLCWLAASGAATGGTSGWKAVVAIVIALLTIPYCHRTLVEVTHPRGIAAWHAIDADRRLAGAFLDQFATPTEVVGSGFGWVAYESHRIFIDGSGLNSRILMPASYLVLTDVDVRADDPAQRGFVKLARFDLGGRLYRGHQGFTVYGLPDSAIALSGKNEEDVDLARLKDETLITVWRQLRRDAAAPDRQDPR